jgi:hypothetical protein
MSRSPSEYWRKQARHEMRMRAALEMRLDELEDEIEQLQAALEGILEAMEPGGDASRLEFMRESAAALLERLVGPAALVEEESL